jgi:signal transduction histidine kinase
LPDLAGRYPIARVGGLAQTLLKLEPIKIDDVQCWDQDPALKHLMRRFNYRTLLVMPMQTDAGAIGVISCSHSQQVRHWDDDDIRLLQAVMGQLAIALKQANLYAQTCSKAAELEQALQELKKTQTQMIQSEKMSSLGQLVAGVAHEINNPVNFIYGNLAYAHDYTQDLLELVKLYQQHYPDPVPAVRKEVDAIDLEFLLEDLPKLLQSMKVGADRIQQIVASLRTFSRMDEAEMKAVDIHEGIDSTLMILQHRLKAGNNYPAIAVIKDYGRLPLVECYVGQLNQVFMNILANAIDALEESQARDKPPSNPTDLAASQAKQPPPQIQIQTQACGPDRVSIRITDNGPGIPETVRSRLFDPFFTTKPVGKGTGMGLSISYQIVTERHGGSLVCCSELGQGAEFQIEIPVLQTEPYMI